MRGRGVTLGTPALRVEPEGRALGPGRREGLGCHEIVVESPAHAPLHDQPLALSIDAMALARDRHRDLWRDRRLVWLGWQQEARRHPLATIAGAAVVPAVVAAEEAVGADLGLVASAAMADRWVADAAGAAAFCPLAPEVPFEVLVVPPRPMHHLADASDRDVEATARLVWEVRRALAAAVGDAPVAVRLHQAPRGGRSSWYLRLRPALALGGSDLGGLLPSHPAFPEAVAAQLRGLWHDAGRAHAHGEGRA